MELPERVMKRSIKLPKGGIMVPIEDDRPATVLPINLEQDGIAFLQSTMLDQKRPLSTAVVNLFNGGGVAFAPLEKGESLEHAKQFNYGRFRPTVAIRQWLADYISSQWGGNGFQLIIEDPWMKPDDFKSRPSKLRSFFSGSGVYYAPDVNDVYTALDLSQKASNFLFFGFIISPSVPLPPSGRHVDIDYIELMARNTQAVFARAYDWEGYVVWQR